MNYKPLLGQKNKVWLWTTANSHRAGILKWISGDRSQSTFCHLCGLLLEVGVASCTLRERMRVQCLAWRGQVRKHRVGKFILALLMIAII